MYKTKASKKRSEKELKALTLKLKQRIDISEEKYRTIFENTGTATLIVEEDRTISLVNGQFEELSGYSREEIEWKKRWTEFVIEEDLERMKKLHYSRRKAPESTLRKYEFRFVNKEGNIRDILIVIDLIPGTEKSVASLLDITERKKTEEIIKKEVEKSKNYLNIAGVVIIALDTEGNITLLNKKGHKILQYNEGELIGKNWFKTCLPKRYRQDNYEIFKKLKQGRLDLAEFNENSILTKNGDEKIIAWHHSLLFDSNGNIIGTLSSGEDITERKKAEEKLKDSEEKHRYFFDNAQVGLYWSGISDGKILECNDIFAKLFGYDTREECLANYNIIEHYIHPNARSELLEEIRDNKEVKNYEIHITRRDGTPIWLSISARMFEKEDRIEGAAIDITERKKAEQKLKENTEFTQNVFNAIQDGLSVLDLDLNILKVNPYIIEMYGPIDQIVNRKCYDVYQKRSSPCPWCPSIKTIETGYLNASIVQYPTNDNPTGWLELTAFPLKNKDGIVEGIIEYVKDITARKNAEEKLQLERDNFLNILNSMEDGVYIVDQNFDIEYINPILIKEFGYFEGMKCFKYFEDLNEPCPRCKNKEVIQGKTVKGEWFSFKNQKTYDVIDTPLKNPDGSISKLGIFRDISERKKVEQELIESEEKFRTIAERSLMGILILQDNQVKYVNKGLLDLFEYSQKDIINWEKDDLINLIHTKDLQFLRKYRERLRSGEIGLRPYYSFRVFTKLGKAKWIDQFSKEIHYKGRSAELVTIIDITEKKEVEQELIKINNLKSELLRRSSHELRTPLVSIKGFSDLLLELHRDKLDDYVIKTIKNIRMGCDRLESLVNDILKTAELKSGTIMLKKTKEDLALLIKICVSELEGLSELRNHTINIEIQDKIICTFEKVQMHEVIFNLLSNAIKFTPPNGKIKIKSEAENSLIVISIKDNGIGFSMEEKNRIFTQFGKIERYGQGYDIMSEGPGLGLYISKKIIEMHGGEIWLESEGRDKGSTFYFSLPMI